MSALPRHPLGASGLEVSVFALGSWRTYERISREEGAAVLQAAREGGIDFLEVARYNDETGTAPIPTGYSEVVFGEVFAASGWPRAEVTIATKLWWESGRRRPSRSSRPPWSAPASSASTSSTAIHRRQSCRWPSVVSAVAELVSSGRVRAWGIVNWPAERVAEAGEVARELGVAPRARRSCRTASSRATGSRARR